MKKRPKGTEIPDNYLWAPDGFVVFMMSKVDG